MTNETEAAAKIVTDLENELETLQGRAAALTKQREQLSYSAKTGDKNAKAKLDKTASEATVVASEIEIVIAALVEARSRLGNAEQVKALEADRAKAVEIQQLQAAFNERLLAIDDACEDIARCTQENKKLLSRMHDLGITAPSHDQVRINSVLALKTMLQGCPWNVQEFQDYPHFLAPSQRKNFKDLASAWDATIERQVADRLPKENAA
jgi:hypothetical protein